MSISLRTRLLNCKCVRDEQDWQNFPIETYLWLNKASTTRLKKSHTPGIFFLDREYAKEKSLSNFPFVAKIYTLRTSLQLFHMMCNKISRGQTCLFSFLLPYKKAFSCELCCELFPANNFPSFLVH